MKNTKAVAFCSIFAALLAISAYIKIPTTPIPITLQTVIVLLCGFLLPKKQAFWAIVLYIGMGLIGIPVFTEGGGIGYVTKPSFGFILGFPLCAYFVANLSKDKTNLISLLIHACLALIPLYTLGTVYFLFISKFVLSLPSSIRDIFTYFFVLLLPGDIISAILASFLAGKLRPLLKAHLE